MRVGLVIDGTDQFFRPIEAELRARHEVVRFKPSFVRLPLIGKRVNDWRLRRQLLSFTARNDVTFFEWATSLLAIATALPKRGRIAVRLHFHEIFETAANVDWSKVDALVLLTQYQREQLAPILADRVPVHLVRNGVNTDRFAPSERQFGYRIGMACSLLPRKRVYEAVLALSELRAAGYPYTLRIAGTGGDYWEAKAYHRALLDRVRELGLEEAVTFDGRVEDVAGWLADVDVFLSNSSSEGLQVALLEAMSAGCYCLSHCWCGVEEVLPPEQIFVTE
ncbi:MAG: glycosyltransferase family 4 protein, partial [Chloroflexi bacterium]|nr:glycosyltransferase family 4 protein [Chloroflexota bacterium]